MQIVRQFVNHVVPGIMRPLRILWNEVIGAMFLLFGIWFGSGTVRNFRRLDQTGTSPVWLIGSGLLALLLIYYGVSSFWRARKISRS